MSIPLLTTTEPGFMGSTGPLLPHQIREQNEAVVIEAPRFIYIHGTLERMVGYDIPVVLSGVFDFSSGEQFNCQVLHPNPDAHVSRIDAVIWNCPEECRWYITLPSEVGQ